MVTEELPAPQVVAERPVQSKAMAQLGQPVVEWPAQQWQKVKPVLPLPFEWLVSSECCEVVAASGTRADAHCWPCQTEDCSQHP